MKEEYGREELLKIIERDAEFKFVSVDIPEKFFHDRQFVMEALRLNGDVYRQLPDDMKKRDKEIILLAAQHYDSWWYLEIDDSLYDDREFVLKLLSVNGQCIFKVRKYIEIDEEILLTAIGQYYGAAAFIPWERRSDREYALKISKISGRTLSYFSEELRDDEEIVFNCASRSYRAFESASDRLKNDGEFLNKLLFANPACLAYAGRKFRCDRQLCEKLMEIHPYVYRYVSKELKGDVEFIVKAMRHCPELFTRIPFEKRYDKTVRARLNELSNDPEVSVEVRETLRMRLRLDADWAKEFRPELLDGKKDEDDDPPED